MVILQKVSFCHITDMKGFVCEKEAVETLRKLSRTLRQDGKNIVRFKSNHILSCRYPTGQMDLFILYPKEQVL